MSIHRRDGPGLIDPEASDPRVRSGCAFRRPSDQKDSNQIDRLFRSQDGFLESNEIPLGIDCQREAARTFDTPAFFARFGYLIGLSHRGRLPGDPSGQATAPWRLEDQHQDPDDNQKPDQEDKPNRAAYELQHLQISCLLMICKRVADEIVQMTDRFPSCPCDRLSPQPPGRKPRISCCCESLRHIPRAGGQGDGDRTRRCINDRWRRVMAGEAISTWP